MMKPSLHPRRRPPAFTLIELLAVIAVLLLLSSLIIGSLNLADATRLTQGGRLFADQLIVARQTAMTRNRSVEVRFFKLPDGSTTPFRGMQTWIADETGGTFTASSIMTILPTGIIGDENAQLSPLLSPSHAGISGSMTLAAHGNCSYVGFRFRPSGEAELLNPASNFLTLRHKTATGTPPANFCAIQIHPLNGKVSILRPN